jgi:hypothetical protein
MFKDGLKPGQELIPLTIDAQYVPGFTWLRNPEARIVQNFGIVSAGLAAESPQAVIFNGPNATLVPTTDTNPGGRPQFHGQLLGGCRAGPRGQNRHRSRLGAL